MLSRTTATDVMARTAASDMSGPRGASEGLGHPSAADKFQSVSSTMQMAAILTSRSSQERRRSSQPITPHSPATSSARRSGEQLQTGLPCFAQSTITQHKKHRGCHSNGMVHDHHESPNWSALLSKSKGLHRQDSGACHQQSPLRHQQWVHVV